jgi:hypothetical protein
MRELDTINRCMRRGYPRIGVAYDGDRCHRHPGLLHQDTPFTEINQ